MEIRHTLVCIMGDDITPALNRRSFLKTTGAVGTAAAFAGVTQATPGRSPGAKEDEILVGVSKTADSPSGEVADAVPGNAEIVHENETLSYVAVKFPAEAADTARQNFIEAVTKKERVKYAEQNATHEALLTPSDPEFGNQYAPQQVNAPTAWDTQLGSSDVTIAVVDQGIKYDHEDLSSQFGSDTGDDFVDGDSDPYPDVLADEYHGTHVGGIAAATTDNGVGVSGISNCSLLSGRALSESGSGSTADIADAIQWAADQGATVVNLSLGGGGYTDTMKNAVSYAVNTGRSPSRRTATTPRRPSPTRPPTASVSRSPHSTRTRTSPRTPTTGRTRTSPRRGPTYSRRGRPARSTSASPVRRWRRRSSRASRASRLRSTR
jgi:serine protease